MENTEIPTEEVVAEEIVSQEEQDTSVDENTSVESETNTQAEHNRMGYEKRQQKKAKFNEVLSENQKLKEQLAQYALQEKQTSQPQQQNTPAPKQRDAYSEPNIDDYENVNDYVRDMARFEAKKIADEQVSQSRITTIKQTFKQKCDEYAKKNPDFYEDIEYATTPVTPAVQEFILTSENGPYIAHALANDDVLASKINSLDPISQMRELVKLELKTEVKPNISQAPAPVGNVKQTNLSQSKSINDMSMEEYMRTMSKLT